MYTIEKATINDDFRILNEIGSTLSKQTETSKNYNNLIFLMDIAQKQIRKKKGFNPFKNLFFYLEVSFFNYFLHKVFLHEPNLTFIKYFNYFLHNVFPHEPNLT